MEPTSDQQSIQIADILSFLPKPWADPPPPWIFDRFQREQIIEWAMIQSQKHIAVLKAEIESTERAMELIQRAG